MALHLIFQYETADLLKEVSCELITLIMRLDTDGVFGLGSRENLGIYKQFSVDSRYSIVFLPSDTSNIFVQHISMC